MKTGEIERDGEKEEKIWRKVKRRETFKLVKNVGAVLFRKTGTGKQTKT